MQPRGDLKAWDRKEWNANTWTILATQLKQGSKDDMMKLLHSFVVKNKTWVLQMSSSLLGKKGELFEDYYEKLLNWEIPPDEIVFHMLAKFFDVHVGVMAAYNQWNTRPDTALDKCDVKLMYLGGMRFLATYEGTMSISDHNFIEDVWKIVTNQKRRDARMDKQKSAKQNRVEGSQKTDTMAGGTDTMGTNDTMPPNDDTMAAGTDTMRTNDTMPPNEDISEVVTESEDANEASTNKDSDYVPSAAEEEIGNANDQTHGIAGRTRSSKNKTEPEMKHGYNTRGNKRTAEDTTDGDKGEPTETEQQAPPPKRRRSDRKKKTEAAKANKAKKAVAKAKAVAAKKKPNKKASLQVVTHALKKRPPPKKKMIKCPLCAEKFKSVRLANTHLKDDHPNTKIKCDNCDKHFLTFNARIKHMAKHAEYKFICQECGRHFPYENQLTEHERKHRKKGTGKIRCSVVSCPKQFCSKRAMTFHLKSHNTDQPRIPCGIGDCLKDFANKANLTQHQRTVHGTDPFKTHCDIELPNPGQRQRHQDRCSACQVVLLQKFNKDYLSRHKEPDSDDSE